MHAFVVILQMNGRYHPAIFEERPLPGNPSNLWRFKSMGHHTAGFVNKPDAEAEAVHIGHRLRGEARVTIPEDQVVTDRVLVVQQPELVLIMRPFGPGRIPFAEALDSSIGPGLRPTNQDPNSPIIFN